MRPLVRSIWLKFRPHYLRPWARMVVRSRKPFIIGVTGSVGKTTTKDMIVAVLTHPGRPDPNRSLEYTRRDMNDDLGVALTLLRFEKWISSRDMALSAPVRALTLAVGAAPYPEVLVLEIGAGWGGHVHRLAKLAPPTIAVVTTVGPAHLERLKTVEGVVQEKMALVKAVPPSGLVVLGEGHDHVATLAEAAHAPVITVPGRGVELSENITRAVCQWLGIAKEIVDSALRDFQPPKHRLNRLVFGEMTVLNDAHNANPLSMKLALDVLAETRPPGRRAVAVLGVMAELGGEARRYHEEIGAYARARADVIVGVGDLAKYYGPDHAFATSQDCADWIASFFRPDDCVLVKGSHSVGMQPVVERLREASMLRLVSNRRVAPPAKRLATSRHKSQRSMRSEIAPPAITASEAYAFNADGGQIYYSKTSARQIPASLNKLATCILIARRFKGSLDDTITIARSDLVGDSTAGLREGDVLSLRDLLCGALIPSANDAATALARHWGEEVLAEEMDQATDPVARFVAGMNALAIELGLTETNFTDPDGRFGSSWTTAKDVARLMEEAINNPVLLPLMVRSRHNAGVAGGRSATLSWSSTNQLVRDHVEGVFAGKTGTGPDAVVNNLTIAWLSPSGERIVAVILNAKSEAGRYADMQAILARLVVDFPELATIPKSASRKATGERERSTQRSLVHKRTNILP